MTVRFLFFAVLRERLGLESEDFTVSAGATVDDALLELTIRHPAIAAILPRIQVAVNRTVVGRMHALADGDELALLPPVAGGSDAGGHGARANSRRVAVLDQTLSLDEVVAAVAGPSQGGLVTFTGMVRRQGHQRNVARLEYEAYQAMAETVLATIASEIEQQWPGTQVAIHHRVGTLEVGAIAVIIAVSAPHRAEAFAGCRAAIEALKERAPIWKKEIGDDGESWVGLGP